MKLRVTLLLSAMLFFVVACEQQAGQEGDGAQSDTTQAQQADTTESQQADTTSQQAAADTVEVTLTEFEINMPSSMTAGTKVFKVTNNGALEHGFEIEGPETEQSLEEHVAPGGTATLQVDLSPGQYGVYCPVEDHAERGMRVDLQVNAAEGSEGSGD